MSPDTTLPASKELGEGFTFSHQYFAKYVKVQCPASSVYNVLSPEGGNVQETIM